MTLPALLEVLSGAMSIVTGMFAMHLIAHIIATHSWREVFHKRPLGLEIALALLITTLGWFGRSIVIWEWRSSRNAPFNAALDQSIWLVLGTLVALVGYLCLIRVFTRVTYGHWPWISTVIVIGSYIALNWK